MLGPQSAHLAGDAPRAGRAKILVTGPALSDQAAALLRSSGYEALHTPPYFSGEALVEMVARLDPAGVIVRMGRFDAAAMDAAPFCN